MSSPATRNLTFFTHPIRYLRWASHAKPAIFYSMILGSLGPVSLVAVPPLRRAFGDEDPTPVPLTYPVPRGPRKKLEGFEDP